MSDSIFVAGFEYSENLSGKSFMETLNLLKNDTKVSEIASGHNTISYRINNGPLMLYSFGKTARNTKGIATAVNAKLVSV